MRLIRNLLVVVPLLVGCHSSTGPVASHESKQHPQITIPDDLDEAHAQLLQMLDKKTLDKMKRGTEDDMIAYHFGAGMWMRNNWGLWGGGKLKSYFNDLGIYHPDDMSGIILDTFWCKLNNKPFRLKDRIARYQEYWRSMEKPKGSSPRDGSKIVWVIVEGQGKGAVHLGISLSDKSYWRYEYGSGRGIEPVTEREAASLDELRQTWAALGTKLEDLAKE